MEIDRIDGQAAEYSLGKIVKEHFDYISPNIFNKDVLLENGEKYLPTFKQDLHKIKINESLGIKQLTNRDIIDWLYGIDYILETKDKDNNPIRIGVDVTSKIKDVTLKLDKLSNRKKALQILDLKFCLVVYWDCHVPYIELSRGQKYGIAGYLLDAIDHCIEKNYWIDDVTIPC